MYYNLTGKKYSLERLYAEFFPDDKRFVKHTADGDSMMVAYLYPKLNDKINTLYSQ